MSGGLPRVTFDGGGKGVYILHIHISCDFNRLSYIHLYRNFYYEWWGLYPKIQHGAWVFLLNKVLSRSQISLNNIK